MKNGFVRSLGRGGICWVDEKGDDWSAPCSHAGFLQLGKGKFFGGHYRNLKEKN